MIHVRSLVDILYLWKCFNDKPIDKLSEWEVRMLDEGFWCWDSSVCRWQLSPVMCCFTLKIVPPLLKHWYALTLSPTLFPLLSDRKCLLITKWVWICNQNLFQNKGMSERAHIYKDPPKATLIEKLMFKFLNTWKYSPCPTPSTCHPERSLSHDYDTNMFLSGGGAFQVWEK